MAKQAYHATVEMEFGKFILVVFSATDDQAARDYLTKRLPFSFKVHSVRQMETQGTEISAICIDEDLALAKPELIQRIKKETLLTDRVKMPRKWFGQRTNPLYNPPR